jgi:hypothetical protein
LDIVNTKKARLTGKGSKATKGNTNSLVDDWIDDFDEAMTTADDLDETMDAKTGKTPTGKAGKAGKLTGKKPIDGNYADDASTSIGSDWDEAADIGADLGDDFAEDFRQFNKLQDELDDLKVKRTKQRAEPQAVAEDLQPQDMDAVDLDDLVCKRGDVISTFINY